MNEKKKAPKKILLAQVPENLPLAHFSDLQDPEDYEIYSVHLSEECLHINQRQTFTTVKFDKVTFDCGPEASLEFNNCIFEKCDLSNLNWSHLGIYRSLFKDCKMLGIELTESHLQNVQFLNNIMTYANFSASQLKSCLFAENNLTESYFTTCKFENVQLENNKLEKANFWETNLKGIDFSGNDFERLEVTPNLLSGIKINLSQAAFFLELMGIEVE